MTNATVQVFVGQKINLTAVEEGAGSSTPSSRTWAVPFGDQPVGGYSWAMDPLDSKLKGKVTAFTNSGTRDQSLYFIRENAFQYVDYTVRYGTGLLAPAPATARVRFNVARPAIAEGQINSQFVQDPVQFKKEPGGDWVLSLGQVIGGSIPGIGFLARVTVPNGGDGQVAYVQLVRTRRSYTLDLQNYPDIKNSGGAWFLDGSAPYGDDGLVSVTAQQPGDAATGDTPQNGAITDDILRFLIDEDFRMFLMYRPNGDDSIWVTLREIDWGWTAVLAHTSGTPWTEYSFESPPFVRGKCSAIPGTCATTPTIVDTSELPEWNDWFPKPPPQ